MSATFRVWPAITRATIAPELFGHQIEMVGQCVYDGIWVGRASRIPNEEGLRMDVLAILKHLRVPVLKWPGDDFANYYHWRDGIGTGQARTVRLNIPGQQIEPNTFGTHEFMLLCEKVGCKPWLTCNSLTADHREALEWVEYCTFGGDTSLTKLRSQYGSPEPFEVPYWSHSPAQSNLTLRALNPEIMELSSTDPTEPMQTDKHQNKPLLLDTPQGRRFTNESYLDSLSRCESSCVSVDRFVSLCDYQSPKSTVPVAVAPWAIVHPEASAESGLEQPCSLRDALLAARLLHHLQSHAGRIRLAAMAQAVNGLLCLVKTRESELHLTPIYHVVDMMQPHKGARALYGELDGPSIKLASGSLPALSVSASRIKKRLCITVANLSYDDTVPFFAEVREAAIGTVTGRVLTAPSAGAENTFEAPKTVSPARLNPVADGNGFRCELPPHSFSAFQLTLK